MKKSTIAALLLSIFLAGSGQAKLIGDFNNDGEISLPDVIAFIMHIMDKETVPEIGSEMVVEREVSPQPTMGLDGPNSFVGEENIRQINLHPVMLELLEKVMDKSWPVLYEKESGRITGDNYGYAEVFITCPYPETVGTYREVCSAEFTAVFYDYSDDGEIFLGGRMNYRCIYPFMEPEKPKYLPFSILGTLNLVGSYNAHLTYDLEIAYLDYCRSVRGKYSVFSWKNKNERSGTGGWMPEEIEVDGKQYQGWMEIDTGE